MQVETNKTNSIFALSSSKTASATQDSFLADLQSFTDRVGPAPSKDYRVLTGSMGISDREKTMFHDTTGYNLVQGDQGLTFVDDNGNEPSESELGKLKTAVGAFQTAGTDGVVRVAPGVLTATSMESLAQASGSAGNPSYYNELVESIMKSLQQP